MITITKQLRTETGHRLNHYDGRCSHLHGHSYLWEVTATAPEMSSNGMVVDFKDLKKIMNLVLDPLDHSMVLAEDDPAVALIADMEATNGAVQRVHIWPENPTAESFAKFAGTEIQSYFAPSTQITITSVKVWETATSFAEWRA